MRSHEFNCCVDGCDRKANYRDAKLCQKHYFRFMRNSTFSLKNGNNKKGYGLDRKYRLVNPKGYQKIFEPLHPLSNMPSGYVYEHRFIIYNKYGEYLPNCPICNIKLNWKICHIDHIDKDVTNNNEINLRPLCRGCNVGRTVRVNNCILVTIDGLTLTIMQWARRPDVVVSHGTIRRRIKHGYSNYDAVYAKSITHPNCISKKQIIKSMIYPELEN